MDSKPDEGDPGPRIIRPIPRRPFNLNFTSATPPDEDSQPTTPHISANDLRFLDPRYQQQQAQQQRTDSSDSLSRATSFMNLTASTLFGIYAPTTPGRDRPGSFDDRDENSSPWGTGAETPAQPSASDVGVDDATFRLMKNRSSAPRRTTSSYFSASAAVSLTSPIVQETKTSLSALLLRAVLLFSLGVGYGVLVTRLPNRENRLSAALQTGSDWRYLTFWGASGVALGSLLPWFDRVWEETFGRRADSRRRFDPVPVPTPGGTEVTDKVGTSPEADWALVVRGIGAFVGIVFAIRKLPWTSTMEASLTLALANPFLWYLIDRSKPGFLLSAAVGMVGSAVLMGLNPDVMPVPKGLFSVGGGGTAGNNGTSAGGEELVMGGLARQETVETGIWMVSVLFCSCVCFGNIGRRLALNSSGSARGRWGGVR